MQKTICMLLFSMLTQYANACDICGCGSSTTNFGILPSLSNHFVGIKYQYKSFHSTPHDVLDQHYSASDETFQTTELWGRMILKKRFQLFASLPYSKNTRVENNSTTMVSGIGDVNIMTSFVWIKPSTKDKNWNHSLQSSIGIKLPTGKYDQLQNNIFLNQNIQLGTGSFDIPTNLMYTIRYKKSGMNTELNYKINSNNKYKYQFGNRFTGAVRLFTQKKIKSLTLLPQLGASIEIANRDKRNYEIENYTGGQFIFSNIGFDTYFNKFALSMQCQKPLGSNYGDGHISSKTRFATSIIYLF